MKDKITNLRNILRPYQDILRFAVSVLVAYAFWKLTVIGDENTKHVSWLGYDLTQPFYVLSTHIANVVYWLIHLIRDTIHQLPDNILRFTSDSGVMIVWHCTAIKQSFIWLIGMLTARGNHVHKLWFIPLGLTCIYLFNILRLVCILLVIEHHPHLFELLHSYIFKYLFYVVLFALWYWWIKLKINKGRTELP